MVVIPVNTHLVTSLDDPADEAWERCGDLAEEEPRSADRMPVTELQETHAVDIDRPCRLHHRAAVLEDRGVVPVFHVHREPVPLGAHTPSQSASARCHLLIVWNPEDQVGRSGFGVNTR